MAPQDQEDLPKILAKYTKFSHILEELNTVKFAVGELLEIQNHPIYHDK